MVFLYNVQKKFFRRFGIVKIVDNSEATSYRMRSNQSPPALLTLEAYITKRPGEKHFLDVIQTNAMPNSRILAVFSDLGIPESVLYGSVGNEDSMIIQRDEEYDKFLGIIGKHISPLFRKLTEKDITLLESFPAMRPYVLKQVPLAY